MRDWNASQASIPPEGPVKFVAYLWGIETDDLLFYDKLNLFTFVAYLWGIETDIRLAAPDNYILVCSLPMRDWNF